MTPPNTTRGMRLPDVLPGSTSPRVVPFSDSMLVEPAALLRDQRGAVAGAFLLHVSGLLRVGREDLHGRVLLAGDHVGVGAEHRHLDESAEHPFHHRGVGGGHEELDLLAGELGHAVGDGFVELELGDGLLGRHHREGECVGVAALGGVAGCGEGERGRGGQNSGNRREEAPDG